MQERDDNPAIRNPGMVGVFGGGAEVDETPVECAMREIQEEIGLDIVADSLLFLGSIDKEETDGSTTSCHFYVASEIDETTLVISEGRITVLDTHQLRNHELISPICRAAINRFL